MQQARRRGKGGGMMKMARTKLLEKDSLVGALALIGVGLLLIVYVLWSSNSSETSQKLRAPDPNHPNLHLMDKNAEQYNAFALDILQTLECHKLLAPASNESTEEGDSNIADKRRRLEEEGPAPVENDDVEQSLGDAGDVADEDVANEGDFNDKEFEDFDRFNDGNMDGTDDFGDFGDPDTWKTPTAKHLFCMAAFASNDRTETAQWKDSIKCDATNSAQKSILELWSMARGEMSPDLLLKVLGLSIESSWNIVGKDLNLWSPRDDSGLDYMVSFVNEKNKTVDQGGLYGLEHNLGPGKTFVDVGSCLGTTSMAMSLLYPGTKIVSIEVASPNWLLQELNFRCNADEIPEKPTILFAGVGPAQSATTSAFYTWKPDQVTTARAWTAASEINSQDETLSVKLRPWHTLLAESEIPHNPVTNQAHIDVLNVDCGACEYNLVPSMSDEEFESITTVMGGVHWGYIPKVKKPSSERGKATHERLCKHENFARTSKECCEFPDMEVISSYPGQVLYQENPKKSIGSAGTVGDVSELCADYDEWALANHVHDIDSDWGWFLLTPSAEGV